MNWKGIFIMGVFIAVQVDCQYLSLLKIFDMRNPVIVGNKSDLQTNYMFRCGIFGFCLLLFPQNERKIYKLLSK